MGVGLKQSWGRQKPPFGTPAGDRWPGLKSLVAFNNAGDPFDVARGVKVSRAGTATWGSNPHGMCGRTAAATDYWNLGNGDSFLSTARQTFIYVRRKHSATISGTGHFGTPTISTDAARIQCFCPYVDGVVYWRWGNSSAESSIGGLSFVGVEYWVFVGGPKGTAIYRNGRRLASNSTAAGRENVGSDFTINLMDSTGDLVDVNLFAILDAEWTAAQVAAWYADPYSLFAPPCDDFAASVAGGGGGGAVRHPSLMLLGVGA